MEVLSVDESIFNQRICIKKSWAPTGINIEPRCLQHREPAVAVMGAISAKYGWVGEVMRNKSIKA